jgi:D-serine deaminase-like pyridoxal phosphate-dependent protein
MANDLLSALRTYLSKVTSGEKSPQEVAAALNAWARESGEAIKIRVEEEVQRTVKRMGFAKQEDLDRLAREVERLKSTLATGTRSQQAANKTPQGKKASAKKATPKKRSAKPVKKAASKKVAR